MKDIYEYAVALVYEWTTPILIGVGFWSGFIAFSWAFRG